MVEALFHDMFGRPERVSDDIDVIVSELEKLLRVKYDL